MSEFEDRRACRLKDAMSTPIRAQLWKGTVYWIDVGDVLWRPVRPAPDPAEREVVAVEQLSWIK